MSTKTQNLTLEEFWQLPSEDTSYELVEGQAIPKVSPKYFHSALQEALLVLFRTSCRAQGRIKPEWSVILKRKNKDWVPTPDLTYISFKRLPQHWRKNEACPVPCDLAIEIISPEQSFKQLAEKAQDYLVAGVLSVWVVHPEWQNITVFSENNQRVYQGSDMITDDLLPVSLSVNQIFAEADLI